MRKQRLNGIIFSDLGRAASFMALDWVQQQLRESLGFTPYPATLNVRPKDTQDTRVWETLQNMNYGIPLPAAKPGSCSARLFVVNIQRTINGSQQTTDAAILLPEVPGYSRDKIEIVAPISFKTVWGVRDGDELTLEFLID